jgi:hypothetical protein
MQRACWLVFLGFALLASGQTQGADEKGTVVEVDGLKSRTPADWKEEKPANKFRLKQFQIPRVEGDKEDAQLLVISLGGGAGGSAEDNVKRWKGLFTPPAGKNIDDVSKVESFKVGDVPVTYVDVQGTYKGATFEKLEPKPDYRMLAVYFDSPAAPSFGTTGPVLSAYACGLSQLRTATPPDRATPLSRA